MSEIQKQEDYRIVTEKDPYRLVTEVNEKLEEGYVLVGGPFIFTNRGSGPGGSYTETVFAQAITKDCLKIVKDY
jgi:hypothetical protein